MTHRIGAALYILWGILHIAAAWEIYRLARDVVAGPVHGRVLQAAFYLLAFSIAAILVAVVLNLKNNRAGYWINLVMVSVADIGFIVFVLLPGHAPVWPGLIGPVLWLLAAVFSTLGILRHEPAT